MIAVIFEVLPPDVTLAELSVELFYPADGATEAALRPRPDAVRPARPTACGSPA